MERESTHSQACLNLDFYEDMFERLERIYLSFPIVHSVYDPQASTTVIQHGASPQKWVVVEVLSCFLENLANKCLRVDG